MASNSDNRNDRLARKVCIALAGVMVLCGIALAGLAISLGPPVGDLTRIGGMSERQFGWQRRGAQYTEDHFRKLALDDLIAQGPEGRIVVFGDSFTDAEQPGTSWLNALYEHTGAEIDFVEYSTLNDVMELLDAPSFATNPPDVVVVEMGERTVFRRAEPLFENANCNVPSPPSRIAANPVQVEIVPWDRRTRFDDFDELMSWGALALRRRVFDNGKTVKVDLSRDDMFTSQRSDSLLIYHSDVIRHTVDALFPHTPDEAAQNVICALRHVINRGAELTEVYVLVVAPDKRSVFEPWIETPLDEKAIRFLDVLPGTLGGRNIEVFDALRGGIESGTKDAYFPNDTHWNDETARNIGRIVSDFISITPN